MRAMLRVGSTYVLLDKEQNVNELMSMVETATVVERVTRYGQADTFKVDDHTALEIMLIGDPAITTDTKDEEGL